MDYKDYYKILDVERTSSKAEIKKAYRKLARKYHPDVSKVANAEERFKEVNEAYEVLADEKKREQYDTLGANWKNGQNFDPPPGWDGGFDFSQFSQGTHSSAGGAGFSDFFESLFGGAGFQQGGFNQQHQQQQQYRKPPAETMILNVDLEDIFSGGKKKIRLPGGSTVEVKIPKGFEEGKKIRLSGKAANGADIHLKINFKKHPKYRLEGKDVYLDLPIAPWEAALGASVTIDTLGGQLKLKIPENSTSGKIMRIKNKGLPGSVTGNQYVKLQIVTPPANTEEEKTFYQEMSIKFDWTPR
ncbi:MAG TPA: J domain-containing protein [Leucothrix sp.]|nr:J domain-containing protein [Leucothrix sp.]